MEKYKSNKRITQRGRRFRKLKVTKGMAKADRQKAMELQWETGGGNKDR